MTSRITRGAAALLRDIGGQLISALLLIAGFVAWALTDSLAVGVAVAGAGLVLWLAIGTQIDRRTRK